MKRIQQVIAILSIFVIASSLPVFAVSELIGLTVEIRTEDGIEFTGLVTGETETAITINIDGESTIIQRDAIESISLIRGRETSQPATEGQTLADDPAFAEVRRAALRKAALWQISQSGISLAQSWLNYLIAKSEPEQNRTDLIYTKVGVAVGGVVLNFILQPNVEERLYWRSQLPAWHGIVGLIGGLANLGAGVSLAFGYVQKYVSLADLEPAEVWFDRSATLFLVKGASDLVHALHAGSHLVSGE